MSAIKEIRQIRNELAKSMSVSIEASVFPGATRSSQIYKKNGLFINGLTEEEEERFGAILNKDLSKTSKFWNEFKVKLVDGNKSVNFNLENPEEYIAYKAGLACRFFAESLHQLKEPGFKDADCCLYVYDPIGEAKLKANLEINKDECVSKLYAMKANQEKLFLICNKLNIFVSKKAEATALYTELKRHLESINKEELISQFKELLNTEVLELEIYYNVKLSIDKGIVRYINGQWMFGTIVFGSNQTKITEYFLNKKNASNYITLKDELENHVK